MAYNVLVAQFLSLICFGFKVVLRLLLKSILCCRPSSHLRIRAQEHTGHDLYLFLRVLFVDVNER